MIIGLVTTAPSQWKKFKMSRPGDAGEQIFVAAGKADDFMRKHRPDDDDLVVVKDAPVDLHRHIHRKQPAGELADFLPRGSRRGSAARRDCPTRD